MLKNKLFASAFALALVLGGASIASAYSFPSVIDTKQEKMDVQTVLNMTTGSTLTVDGVLGAKSIAAVKAFQTMKGLVADGKIGPMTRAALEAASVGGSTVSTVAGCAAGATFSATTGAACTTTVTSTVAGCAAGAAFSATTGAACGTTTVVTPGTTMTGSTDGSLTLTQSSYVASGITLKKGETKDITSVRMQATSGPVAVKYVDVQFNVRPWLLFGSVTLHDANGKVLATKTLSSIADTTEISVGNTYLVRFDGLNYVVTPGTNADLAVSASVLAATDKITDGMQVTATITSMRTVSEVGYSNTVSNSYSNTVTLRSTGSVADMYVRVSPSSPVAGQQVVNLTQVTQNVNLGIFSLKAANNNATVNSVTVNAVNDSGSIADTHDHLTSSFSNFRLFVNGASIGGGTISSTGTSITFNNLTLPLTQDAWLDVTLMADVAANVSGGAHFTLADSSAGLTVTDANYGTVTFSSANTASTNVLTFTTNSLTIGAISASLGSAITNSNSTVGNNATYAFTLTNSSNNDLFVSSTPATFMPMTGTNVGSSALSSVIASPSTVNGDTVSAFALPSGTSRTFTFSGALRGTGVTVTLKALSIVYGTSAATPTGLSITTGLSGLSLTASY